METSVKITLIIVCAVLVLALIGVGIFYQSNASNVNVAGNSQVKAVPDLVSVYFNIETSAETAKEAKDNNSEIFDKVLNTLIGLGFERKEITTENFNIYPEYNWQNGGQEITGYRATHNIKIELSTSNTEKIGELIDAGVDNGATISYINFELSLDKQNEYKSEAIKLATEDARIKGESLASGLGKKLGKVVSISYSDFGYSPWPIYMAREGSAGVEEAKQATTDIQPGEQDVNAMVEIVFELK